MMCINCKNLCNVYKDKELIYDWCNEIYDCPDTRRKRECEYYRSMNNGDKLRSLNNKELASYLWYILDEFSEQSVTARHLEEFLNKEISND